MRDNLGYIAKARPTGYSVIESCLLTIRVWDNSATQDIYKHCTLDWLDDSQPLRLYKYLLQSVIQIRGSTPNRLIDKMPSDFQLREQRSSVLTYRLFHLEYLKHDLFNRIMTLHFNSKCPHSAPPFSPSVPHYQNLGSSKLDHSRYNLKQGPS